MKIEAGKTYLMDHVRKGSFGLRVTEASEEWVDGVVTKGKPKMMNPWNAVDPGDSITVRRSFISSAVEETP